MVMPILIVRTILPNGDRDRDRKDEIPMLCLGNNGIALPFIDRSAIWSAWSKELNVTTCFRPFSRPTDIQPHLDRLVGSGQL